MRRQLSLLSLAALALVLGGCGVGGSGDIEKLLDDLRSESPRARRRAERNLAEHGRAIIKPLGKIVSCKNKDDKDFKEGSDTDSEEVKEELELDGDPIALRVVAARALGLMAKRASLARSEAENAAKPLLEVLHHNDKPLRIEAVKALGYFTQLSAPANDIILLLRDDDDEVAAAVAESLQHNVLQCIDRVVVPDEPQIAASAKKGDPALLGQRLEGTSDDMRLDVVQQIAATEDMKKGVPLLLERLAKDKSHDVRHASIRFCLAMLKKAKEAEAGASEKAEAMSPELVAELYTQFATSFEKDKDSRVAVLAARAVDQALAAPARDKKGTVAAAAAEAASKVLDTAKREKLEHFLTRLQVARDACERKLLEAAGDGDADDATRADTILALRDLHSTERNELLATFLDKEQGESSRIRRAAARVLARALTRAESKSDAALSKMAADALAVAMTDEDSIVKLIAAQALGGLGGDRGDRAVEYLVDLLAHKEAKVWTPAADALGTLRAQGLRVLTRLLRDKAAEEVPEDTEEDDRRKHEQNLVGIICGIGNIVGDLDAKEQASAGCGDALGAVLAAARSELPAVRLAAVEALGNFRGRPTAIQTLADALHDDSKDVRWYAARALERRGAAAVKALTAALDDADVGATAARALARIAARGDAPDRVTTDVVRTLIERSTTAQGESKAVVVWAIGEVLGRPPSAPAAAEARKALVAARDDPANPDAARFAASALDRLERRAAKRE